MPLTEIRKQLPGLSKTELAQLKLEVDFLVGKSTQFLNPYQQMLYRNIIGALRRIHIRYMPYNEQENHKPRLRGYNHAQFVDAYDAIEEYIQTDFLGQGLPDALRHQFYSILVWEAVRILDSDHEPAGIKGVLETLKDPDMVLDHAFPGYARAVLLRNILG
jgi:hypothetical protein